MVDMGDDRDVADVHQKQNLGAPPAGADPLGAPGLGDQLGQIELGASADMTDDFGSAQAADLAADGERQVAGQAVKKAAGIEIARPRGVDHASDRRRIDAMLGAGRQDDAARCAAGQGGDGDAWPRTAAAAAAKSSVS